MVSNTAVKTIISGSVNIDHVNVILDEVNAYSVTRRSSAGVFAFSEPECLQMLPDLLYPDVGVCKRIKKVCVA